MIYKSNPTTRTVKVTMNQRELEEAVSLYVIRHKRLFFPYMPTGSDLPDIATVEFAYIPKGTTTEEADALRNKNRDPENP